ncbi:MOSC domain-containing protein [Bacillus sp. T33-2]|nr:MOSC domain-containing protein [Bacillus sp. T33-2]PLR95154.1 MOSC domain-containing protein [Bacillus sp. T33-2]
MNNGTVTAVSISAKHTFSKENEACIRLLKGLGVEGDAHLGEKVKHRYRVARNPDEPNLRQVHLIHSELFDELKVQGFDVCAGQLGENITTCGVDLLGLPTGTRLHIGETAVIEVTGLRSPCKQIDQFQHGLMAAVLDRDSEGKLIRKAGIMAIVLEGGIARPEDQIRVELPSMPHRTLQPV